MKFIAAAADVAKLAAAVFNASKPVGMGFVHHQEGDQGSEAFQDAADSGEIDMDYAQGRMIKTTIRRVEGEDELWSISPAVPRPDYQSWWDKYNSTEILLPSVGLEPLPEES